MNSEAGFGARWREGDNVGGEAEDKEVVVAVSCLTEASLEMRSGLVCNVLESGSVLLLADDDKPSTPALPLVASVVVGGKAFLTEVVLGHHPERTMKSKGRQSRFSRLQLPHIGFFSSQLA